MPTFRFHKSTLKESLKTSFHMTDKEDLFYKINNFNKITVEHRKEEDKICISSNLSHKDQLIIKPYIFDERIGWNTQLVIIHNRCITKDPYVIGYLSDPID